MADASPPRTPSNRYAAWDWWRRRVAGEALDIPADPQCGFYRTKRGRGGDFVAASIDLEADTDPETNELISDERLVCIVGDYERDVDQQWLFLAANPISEAEFNALRARPRVTDLARQVIT